MATANTRMSTVEKLPTELLLMTMSYLKPEDVLNLTLTSEQLNDVVKRHQVVLADTLLRNHCEPKAIQMAIAHHAAAVAGWKPSKSGLGQSPKLQDMQIFCDQYLTPHEKMASLPEKSLNLRSIRHICAFHDASLRLARKCFDYCLEELTEEIEASGSQLDLSGIQKAVYIIAIVCHILHSRPRNHRGSDRVWDTFSQCFSAGERAEVQRIMIFLTQCVNTNKPLGGRSIPSHIDKVFARTPIPLPEIITKRDRIAHGSATYYMICGIQRLTISSIMAHGMEYLIMPASSYWPQQGGSHKPVDVIRTNRLLRADIWVEADRLVRTQYSILNGELLLHRRQQLADRSLGLA